MYSVTTDLSYIRFGEQQAAMHSTWVACTTARRVLELMSMENVTFQNFVLTKFEVVGCEKINRQELS